MPKVGNKYSLSEKNNPEKYKAWIATHSRWREFHDWVKSGDFIAGVLAALKQRGVDLGLSRAPPAASGCASSP